MSYNDGLSTTFKTSTRASFVKAAYLIASGLVLTGSTRIAISGKENTQKSLAADAIVNYLDDNAQKYNVPVDNKMCFESISMEALKLGIVSGEIIQASNKYQVHFVRNEQALLGVQNQDEKTIIFYSERIIPNSFDPDISIYIKEVDPFTMDREWVFEVCSAKLITDPMKKVLEHLKAIHQRQSARGVLTL